MAVELVIYRRIEDSKADEKVNTMARYAMIDVTQRFLICVQIEKEDLTVHASDLT